MCPSGVFAKDGQDNGGFSQSVYQQPLLFSAASRPFRWARATGNSFHSRFCSFRKAGVVADIGFMSAVVPCRVEDVVQTYRLVRASSGAGAMLLLFDWLIRLDDEVELIWRSAITPPQILYFISRYFGFFVQIIFVTDVLPSYCPAQLYFRSVAYFILHWSVELSLMIRIYALWGQQRSVARFLAVTWLGEQATNVAMSSVAMYVMARDNVPYPKDWPVTGCQITSVPHFFQSAWIPVLLYETLLFVMNTYKCLSFRPLCHTPLIVRIFRDGTIYYFIMCFVMLVHIVSQFRPELINSDVIDTWMASAFSIVGSHLMLSIRKLAAERQRKHLATPDISVAIPDFVAQPRAASNFDSLSSRNRKRAMDDSDIEMSSLSNRADIRVIPHRQPIQNTDQTDGPPRLSLNNPLTCPHPHLQEDVFLNSDENSVLQRSISHESSRFPRCPFTQDLSWLEDWSVKG